jgi:ABC-2 type transport system permease protein
MLLTFYSFLLRDFRQTISYRFAFLLDLGSVIFNATTFYFVGKMFDAGTGPTVGAYPGGYFPFVLIGIAFSSYQSVGLNSFAQTLRQEQYIGTLESVLATPIRIPTFLAGSALWDFLYATVEIFLYFLIGFAVFGFDISQINVISAFCAAVLTLTTFMGLGILAAAFILRFKKGNPVTWMIASAGELFGGVYFPPTLLPGWMKSISDWVPMTHSLNALRQSFLAGSNLTEIQNDLFYLLGFTLGPPH